MVKEHRSHVVQMAVQGEETSSSLIRPYFDFVVVSTRNEERLCLMKVDASYGTIMLLESIDKGPHPVIPKLYGRRVKGDKNPWPANNVSSCTEFLRTNLSTNRFEWNAIPLALEDFDSN